MIYGLSLWGSPLVPFEIESIKYFSFECLVLELAVKRTEGLLGFTHFHCHRDVVDLDPGTPYEDMSFSHGGIHAGVRMCKIVVCGWGALMNTWKDPDGDMGDGGESDKVPYYLLFRTPGNVPLHRTWLLLPSRRGPV